MATSLRAWIGLHIAPKRGKVEDVLSAGTIEEDDDKLGQAVTSMALTSLKRLAERQAVIKRAQAGMPSGRSITIALCIEASAIRLTYFGCRSEPREKPPA